jgi:hypothetical protein
MVLDTQTSFPAARSYVLKLHRDAAPERGEIFGRLENVSTGKQFSFADQAELIAILLRDAQQPNCHEGG